MPIYRITLEENIIKKTHLYLESPNAITTLSADNKKLLQLSKKFKKRTKTSKRLQVEVDFCSEKQADFIVKSRGPGYTTIVEAPDNRQLDMFDEKDH